MVDEAAQRKSNGFGRSSKLLRSTSNPNIGKTRHTHPLTLLSLTVVQSTGKVDYGKWKFGMVLNDVEERYNQLLQIEYVNTLTHWTRFKVNNETVARNVCNYLTE